MSAEDAELEADYEAGGEDADYDDGAYDEDDFFYDGDDGVMTGSAPDGADRGAGSIMGARSIGIDDIDALLRELARSIGMITATSEDEAILLLASFKWHPRRVEEALFGDDATATRSKIGISALGRAGDGGVPPALPDGATPADTFFDEFMVEDAIYAEADACVRGHWFSAAMWQGHLRAAANEPKTALTQTRCPAYPDCNELVRPRLFRRFVPELMPRLEHFRARSFAEGTVCPPFFRACPAPSCDLYLCMDVREGEAACRDGHLTCLACGRAAHAPASCECMPEWEKRAGSDFASRMWMTRNAKPCPGCKKTIFKDGGCNQVRCPRTGGCNMLFCWICLQDWDGAGHRDHYNCHKGPVDAWAGSQRNDDEHFAFYYERHIQHAGSSTHAQGNKDRVAAVVERLLAATGSSAAEFSFVSKALDLIVRGQRIVANSYIHAFNITDPAYRALFEDSQGLLIGNLEKLHALLETRAIEALLTGVVGDHGVGAGGPGASAVGLPSHDVVSAAASAWRQQVMSLLSATSGFLDRFLLAVQRGFMHSAAAAAGVSIGRAASNGSTGSAGRRLAMRRQRSGSSSKGSGSTSSSRAGSGALATAGGAIGGAGAAAGAGALP